MFVEGYEPEKKRLLFFYGEKREDRVLRDDVDLGLEKEGWELRTGGGWMLAVVSVGKNLRRRRVGNTLGERGGSLRGKGVVGWKGKVERFLVCLFVLVCVGREKGSLNWRRLGQKEVGVEEEGFDFWM